MNFIRRCVTNITHKLSFLLYSRRRARAIPHPSIEGAYTVNDPMAPRGRLLVFASKRRAEESADKRNEQRRQQK